MNPIDSVKLLSFKAHHDRGSLVAVAGERECPFPIARVFYTYGMEAATGRGDHAHYNCNQLLICMNGACEVTCDDGHRKLKVTLASPDVGLLVPKHIWASQLYATASTVLLVLTDQLYSAADYIRDYDEFLRFRRSAR